MKRTSFALRVVLTAALFTAALAMSAAPAAGQAFDDYFPPAKGDPPPAGWEEKWVGHYEASLQDDRSRPPGFRVVNRFDRLDEIILPLLKPWAREARKQYAFLIEDPGVFGRQNGMMMHQQVVPFSVIPSPGKITVLGGGGTRRIYLNRGHLKNPRLTRSGDSVAHWEGDTLVIDTVGFDDQTVLEATGTPHTTQLHIVERWRLVANDEWMEKVFVVDDWKALTVPFTYTRYNRRVPASEVGAFALGGEATNDSIRNWVRVRNETLELEDKARAEAAKKLAEENQKKTGSR